MLGHDLEKPAPDLIRNAVFEKAHAGQDILHDHIDPLRGRMQAVSLIEPGVGGNTLQEKRIQRHREGFREFGIDRIEAGRVVGPVIRWREHSAQHDRDPARLQPAHNVRERRSGDRGIDAAKCVVGAEFHDHGVGSVRHRPVEPVTAAGTGVAGHPGVDHLNGYPIVFQRLLQPLRERRRRRQAKARAQRITQHDHLDRFCRGCSRCLGKRRPCGHQAQAQHEHVHEHPPLPLDRGGGSAI